MKNITATGLASDKYILHRGGYGTLLVTGDFAGNTVTVHAQFPQSSLWIKQDSVIGEPIEITENKNATFLLSECKLCISVDGGSLPDIKFEIYENPVVVFKAG